MIETCFICESFQHRQANLWKTNEQLQARIEDLEKERDEFKTAMLIFNRERIEALATVERLKGALEWYADPEQYYLSFADGFRAVRDDFPDKARQALSALPASVQAELEARRLKDAVVEAATVYKNHYECRYKMLAELDRGDVPPFDKWMSQAPYADIQLVKAIEALQKHEGGA